MHTILIGSQVKHRGVIYGRPRARRRGNSDDVWKVLPELGEQVDVFCGRGGEGGVERPVDGGMARASLFQIEQIEHFTIGLQGRIPTDHHSRGAEDLSCEVVDRTTRYCRRRKRYKMNIFLTNGQRLRFREGKCRMIVPSPN